METEEPGVRSASLSPSPALWVMMCFALLRAPRDSWLSEHIPLTAIRAPPPHFLPSTHTHTETSRRCSPSLHGPPPRASACRDSALTLSPCPHMALCFAFFFLLFPPLAVTLIRSPLPLFFFSLCWVGGALIQMALSPLFCQIAKLATVFNHSHSAKSHEVIKNF